MQQLSLAPRGNIGASEAPSSRDQRQLYVDVEEGRLPNPEVGTSSAGPLLRLEALWQRCR